MLAKKYSDKNLEVIGAGISGNKVPDLQGRLQKDVLDKDPTVVVIYIGINDVWHSTSGHGTPIDEFESGLREIIGKIKDDGARVFLCTPSTIGEKADGSNDLDSQLEEFSSVSRKIAKETDSPLIDLRKFLIDYLKDANKENQASGILTTDGVHLNEQGNKVVAKIIATHLMKGGKAINTDKSASNKVLRHVVMFKFKDDIDQEEIDKIVIAFAMLPGKIDSIIDFESGSDISVENKAKGFTHCFVVTFKDAAGRDDYLPHSAHKEFVQMLSGSLDDVLVFDYETAN